MVHQGFYPSVDLCATFASCCMYNGFRGCFPFTGKNRNSKTTLWCHITFSAQYLMSLHSIWGARGRGRGWLVPKHTQLWELSSLLIHSSRVFSNISYKWNWPHQKWNQQMAFCPVEEEKSLKKCLDRTPKPVLYTRMGASLPTTVCKCSQCKPLEASSGNSLHTIIRCVRHPFLCQQQVQRHIHAFCSYTIFILYS
jgi:hypothetical protein